LVLIGITATQTHAAEVLAVEVTRDSASFVIGMHVAINAAPQAVFRALQDYEAMLRYNPDLRAVRVEPTSEANRVRLSTTIHTCVLFFCKTMQQEQVMTSSSDGNGGVLQSELSPENGAFRGSGRWTVTPCRTDSLSSCMDVHLVLVPEFWVPPVLGPWLIRRKMNEEAQRSSAGIEVVAQGVISR
jgi:hypothetical protein